MKKTNKHLSIQEEMSDFLFFISGQEEELNSSGKCFFILMIWMMLLE